MLVKKLIFFSLITIALICSACKDEESINGNEQPFIAVTEVKLDQSSLVLAPGVSKTIKAIIFPVRLKINFKAETSSLKRGDRSD